MMKRYREDKKTEKRDRKNKYLSKKNKEDNEQKNI